jgi:hypothetical protein
LSTASPDSASRLGCETTAGNRKEWDVDREGLPVDRDIELLVEGGGRLQGRFLLSAAPRQHPSTAQRLVAVTLAAQVGAALR